jgi:SulP family sulfate permease
MLLAGGSVLLIVLWPKVSRRVPGPFVALVAATAVVQIFHLPVETIGSRFGSIAASVPHPQVPHLTLTQVSGLIGPAFTIALLGAVESLLSAVVADGMIGGRHRSNMELVAQGLANIAAPLFGGIPATGAIARTATNVKNGGRTPVAGMIHALTLLVITLGAGRWAALIPMPVLAAILVVVAYHMSEWREFLSELRAPKSDVAVLVTTFSLTILVDLTVAIEVGMVMAAFLFVRRMAEATDIASVTKELEDDEFVDLDPLGGRAIPDGVEVYEINGPFFFGAAEKFKDTIARLAKLKVLIIRMREVPALDSTAMHVLRDIVRRTRHDGTVVMLSELQDQPKRAIAASPLAAELGEENVVSSLSEALERAGRMAR